jgi:hypothetical protein
MKIFKLLVMVTMMCVSYITYMDRRHPPKQLNKVSTPTPTPQVNKNGGVRSPNGISLPYIDLHE